MTIFIVLLNFILASHAVSDTESPPEWVQTGCTLRGKKDNVKSFPGHMCIFQDDGSFISVGSDSIKKFSPVQEVLWEVKGIFHHQINLSSDRKRILAIGTGQLPVKGKTARQDTFLILDQNGKELSKNTVDELTKPLGIKPLEIKQPHVKADFEISHFNSIYEIPENSRAKEIDWLRPGNIIVNSLVLGIFILDPELKKVLKHLNYFDISVYHFIHDVQVTPEGNFLFYNNVVKTDSGKSYSAIQEIHPVTKAVAFEFTSTPKEFFFSAWGGGVQQVGDYLLFSHAQTGGYLYSRKLKDIVKTYPLDPQQASSRWIQDIKVPSPGFLKNSK